MLPVWQAYSNRVCSVSTSLASISVVSNKRSNMFISTVPFLVTICFKLKVFSFSLCGSKAVFRSAKGSAAVGCVRTSWVLILGFCAVGAGEAWPPLCRRSAGCVWVSRGSSATSKVEAKARLAVTGRYCTKPASTAASAPKSKIFIKAFSIFLKVILSITKKATSSGLASFTCGCAVSCKKRHKARMTCATSSTPLGGSLPVRCMACCTCVSNCSGTGAAAAATRPSLP
mmetsp:Transcript_68132/g.149671  ORF Transcript_68132/g.149671 Transcript_68132/m.149671 type:complete len:229 (-) Transcript_68132:808-1494(-)